MAPLAIRRTSYEVSILVTAGLLAATGMAKAQDLAAGEQSFEVRALPFGRRGRQAQDRPGVERSRRPQVRHRRGYNYSEANKKAEIIWSEATFKDYILNPMAKMPGTKMAFAGIKNDKEIADLWGYLNQFKANGKK